MTVRCPILVIGVNHVHVPQTLRIFVEQVTPQGSGVMCFQHLQYHGASSRLMRTGKLADLMLIFSSIFLLYISHLWYFIYHPSVWNSPHLLRVRGTYAPLETSLCLSGALFPLGMPRQPLCYYLLGEKRNPPAREGKSPAHLLIFRIIFWRLKA